MPFDCYNIVDSEADAIEDTGRERRFSKLLLLLLPRKF